MSSLKVIYFLGAPVAKSLVLYTVVLAINHEIGFMYSVCMLKVHITLLRRKRKICWKHDLVIVCVCVKEREKPLKYTAILNLKFDIVANSRPLLNLVQPCSNLSPIPWVVSNQRFHSTSSNFPPDYSHMAFVHASSMAPTIAFLGNQKGSSSLA